MRQITITNILKLLFISIFSGFLFSCSSEEKKASTAEEAYQIAQDFEKDERYIVAIQRYTDVKNKFPYSSFATMAELAIADVQFKSEDYAEAQISYQMFRELHPKHPKIDYVIFRTGLSYFMQLPETIDRDLTLATDAIYSFNEIIKKFPNSDYLAEAKDYRQKAFVMLGEKELYIADFYFKQELYDSALLRYESAFKKYGEFGFSPRSLFGALQCADHLNDDEKKKKYSDILLKQFSDSEEANEAKKKGLL